MRNALQRRESHLAPPLSPDVGTARTAREPTSFDRVVYQQLAAYCFGEAVCWPSQALIARELGCDQSTVSRSITRLQRAGWLRVIDRRWSPRARWKHNVYALLERFAPVSRWVADRIDARSRFRGWWRFSAAYERLHSNRKVVSLRPGFSAPIRA